jgi:hypothetical protein
MPLPELKPHIGFAFGSLGRCGTHATKHLFFRHPDHLHTGVLSNFRTLNRTAASARPSTATLKVRIL